jgi:hypothetical protein
MNESTERPDRPDDTDLRPPTDDAQEQREAPEHGPGGMDAIDDDPVRAPEDDDAPGGMTGIPDPQND